MLDAPLPAALRLLLWGQEARGASGGHDLGRRQQLQSRGQEADHPASQLLPSLQPISGVNTFLQYVLFIACFTKRGFARC